VPARERVGRVDVGVAGGAERGGVGPAGDARRRVLADLAEPDPRVSRPGAVRARVAPGAEERRVRAAVEPRRLGPARVARPRVQAPVRPAHRLLVPHHRSLTHHFAVVAAGHESARRFSAKLSPRAPAADFERCPTWSPTATRDVEATLAT
jgi:hypothetical protein